MPGAGLERVIDGVVDQNAAHAGAFGGECAFGRIFKHEAVAGGDVEAARCFKEKIGRGLAVGYIFNRNDGLEQRQQVDGAQGCDDVRAASVGGDGHGQAGVPGARQRGDRGELTQQVEIGFKLEEPCVEDDAVRLGDCGDFTRVSTQDGGGGLAGVRAAPGGADAEAVGREHGLERGDVRRDGVNQGAVAIEQDGAAVVWGSEHRLSPRWLKCTGEN